MRRRKSCTSATRVTASLLLSSFLAVTSSASANAPHHAQAEVPILPPQPAIPISEPNTPDTACVREFALRHVFHRGTYKYPDLHRRLDVPVGATVWIAVEENEDGSPALNAQREPLRPLRIKSQTMDIQRLVDRSKETIDGILDWGRERGRGVHLAASDWTIDAIPGPNITDRETVLSFARMASNAYILEPGTGDWKDVGCGYNYTEDFGWESDGLRGHIFADTTNSTVVIGLKGTSPAVFDGSETTTNDKINDNLFFSCCCGQGGQFLWRQVCDCQTSAYTCNSTCLVTALRDKNRYYYAARDLYHNATALYPDAEIWMAGHSLGGAVSSFLGLTYGHPAITFEAVPDAMAASRLGLPVPPGHQIGSLMQTREMTGGFHFGHTADPIYMGTCNTASSSCTFGGYALQSVCHSGYKCVYDTVADLGWRIGIGNHKILNVIHDVIEHYDVPAKCEQYINCTDCYPWQFFESNGTEPTGTTSLPSSTSTSTSKVRTRTETCKTPGWFGCLDESTTTTMTTTTTSSASRSSETTSCKTWGWFGCKDDPEDTTTTTAITTTSSHRRHHTPAPAPVPSLTTTTSRPTASPSTSPSSSSYSCKHPGWFGGCYDPRPTSSSSSTKHTPTSTSSTTECRYPGFFGGCWDPPPQPSSSSEFSSPTSTLTPTGPVTKHPKKSHPRPTSTSTAVKCTTRVFFGLICLDPAPGDGGEEIFQEEVLEM